jgi:uncharacterized membrane protein
MKGNRLLVWAIVLVFGIPILGVALLYAIRAQGPGGPISGPLPLVGIALILPVLFVILLVLFTAAVFARARRGDRYEQLTRLAGLRERAAITEEEFQREKRRILG